jgi:hypothetical protein
MNKNYNLKTIVKNLREADQKEQLKKLINSNPAKAEVYDPIYGPTYMWVHAKGSKPNTLVVGTRAGGDLHMVSANTVTFVKGIDSERFGISYKDPYDLHESVVNEADEDETPKESGNDSIDRQIDRYFADVDVAKSEQAGSGTYWNLSEMSSYRYSNWLPLVSARLQFGKYGSS